MDTISECHSRLVELIGPGAEPIEVLRRTEEHRCYWRPERVRVILLAESHVYTTPEELTRTITVLSSVPRDVPRGFVRLVYCLGYGENRLLNRPIDSPANTGTPQFWKIFYSCVNPVRSSGDFASIQSGVSLAERIANKVAVLQRLRELGVWLVDTSLAALYLPGRPKPSRNTRAACLQASWDLHVRSVVDTAAPSHVVCIGKEVARALGDRLRRIGVPVTVVAQPNARQVSADHQQSFLTYYGVVRQANSPS